MQRWYSPGHRPSSRLAKPCSGVPISRLSGCDAKLAVLIGFVTGWFGAWVTVYAFAIGAVLAGVVGVAVLGTRHVGRDHSIAFGPFMLAGALAAIVWLSA